MGAVGGPRAHKVMVQWRGGHSTQVLWQMAMSQRWRVLQLTSIASICVRIVCLHPPQAAYDLQLQSRTAEIEAHFNERLAAMRAELEAQYGARIEQLEQQVGPVTGVCRRAPATMCSRGTGGPALSGWAAGTGWWGTLRGGGAVRRCIR